MYLKDLPEDLMHATQDQKDFAIMLIDNILAVHFESSEFSKSFRDVRYINITTTDGINLNVSEDLIVGELAYTQLTNTSNGKTVNIIKNYEDQIITDQMICENTGVAQTFLCIVEQKLKAPFLCDTKLVDNTFYKIIKQEIQQATILQLRYIMETDLMNNSLLNTSESISTNSNNFTRATDVRDRRSLLYPFSVINLLRNYI